MITQHSGRTHHVSLSWKPHEYWDCSGCSGKSLFQFLCFILPDTSYTKPLSFSFFQMRKKPEYLSEKRYNPYE